MTGALPIVVRGLIDCPAEGGQPQILGSRCSSCSALAYPPVEVCIDCGGGVAQVSLGATGTLYSYTAVRMKPPLGLPSPYWVGYVDLDEVRLRIFGLLDATVPGYRIGQPVELRAGALGVDVDGHPCLRPYFAPRTDSR